MHSLSFLWMNLHEDELCKLHAEAAVNVHFVDKSTTTCHLNKLFHHQQGDDTLLKVINYVQTGWPEVRNEVIEEARAFRSVRHNLYMASVGENFVFLANGRTVIPAQQQKKTLSNLTKDTNRLKNSPLCS